MTTKPMARAGRIYRRGQRRLETRIHALGDGAPKDGIHRLTGKCGCALWDRDTGFTKPGSTKGQA